MYIIYFYGFLHFSPLKTLEYMSEATKIYSVFIFFKNSILCVWGGYLSDLSNSGNKNANFDFP